jgi:redox-sensitive bicupin YhaK (pirin superfamily)
MTLQRGISRIVTAPPLTPGFAGRGHLAAQLVAPEEFARNDPFILLMDDHLDMGDRQVGGAHPHAGFETVTLLLEGTIHDPNEGGLIRRGEVQWMTAGRGIIHGENARARGAVRLLQLWLVLPKSQRWTAPAFQDIHAASVPIRREPAVQVRVYSGASGGVHSSTHNHVPVTMAEIAMQPHGSIDQDLPASYNGFVFVVSGSVWAGTNGTPLKADQVGWLDRPDAPGMSVLHLTASAEGARVVLYAGQPQGDTIVLQGPFVGDSVEDLRRLYADYRAGGFARMSEVAAPARRSAADRR